MSKIDYRELRKQDQTPSTFAEDIFPHKLSVEPKVSIVSKEARKEPAQSAESLSDKQSEDKTQDPTINESTASPPTNDIDNSEKVEILASFEKYVEDNGHEVEDRKEVSFPGGKASQKVEVDHTVVLDDIGDDLLASVNFFDGQPEEFDQLKVIFVCEKPGDMLDDNPGQDILSKMIVAMKLEKSDYMRIFINKESDNAFEVWQQIINKFMNRTQLTVVSMGAFTTNTLIGKKERLSKIHGKQIVYSYKRDDNILELSLFPVFHPDILKINPNMKRSAWIDLQKVMKHLVQD